MAALRLALSDERLAAYATPVDEDELDSVARYLWNVALAGAMGPGLHALEVTLRNNLFNASRRVVDETRLRFAEVPCWLDADPSLLYEREEVAVTDAKKTLRRAKKPMTPGRLVAALPFGFWVGLFGAHTSTAASEVRLCGRQRSSRPSRSYRRIIGRATRSSVGWTRSGSSATGRFTMSPCGTATCPAHIGESSRSSSG